MDKTSKIFKIFSGQASAEEIAEIEAWLNRDPSHRRAFNDVKQFCSEAELYSSDEDVRKRYDSLLKIQQKVQRGVRRKKRITSARWIGVLVVMVLCNGYLFGLFPFKNEKDSGIRYENLTVQALLLEMAADHGATTKRIPRGFEDQSLNVVFYGFEGTNDLMDALESSLNAMPKEDNGSTK